MRHYPNRTRNFRTLLLVSLVFSICITSGFVLTNNFKQTTPSSPVATPDPLTVGIQSGKRLILPEQLTSVLMLSATSTTTPTVTISPSIAAPQLVQPKAWPVSTTVPLFFIRLLAKAEDSLPTVLLSLEAVQAGRLIPIEYTKDTSSQLLLALISSTDEQLYKKLFNIEYTLLDKEADTARYFAVSLPKGGFPAGSNTENWLDSSWKILDQRGNRAIIKVTLPFRVGFGFRAGLIFEKLPPRIHLPGLTKPCPCPGLATATFSISAPSNNQPKLVLSPVQLKEQLAEIKEENLRVAVEQVARNEVTGKGALNTRYTGHEGSVYFAQRLYLYFFALGLAVEYDTFPEAGLGTIVSNVIAEYSGKAPGSNLNVKQSENESRAVVLVAHYDSLGVRNLQGIADPQLPAFGANDNGVGIVGLLEIARITSSYLFQQPLRFIAFAAEEQAMLGSQHYVTYHLLGEKPKAIVNLDSFGYNPGEEDWVILSYSKQNISLKNDLLELQKNYQINLRLDARTGEPFFRSDDYYFDKAGLPVVTLTDSFQLQSPNNHTANDVTQNINFRTTRKVIQLMLGATVLWAGI